MYTPPTTPHHLSRRLRGFDYRSAQTYFVTTVTRHRIQCLSRIEDGRVELSDLGRVVETCWLAIPVHCEGVHLDLHVVMPDHVHGIIALSTPRPPRGGSLASIVGSFKSAATRLSGRGARTLWETSFHDRIVRSERELEAIRGYIADNPGAWSRDATRHDDAVPWRRRAPRRT